MTFLAPPDRKKVRCRKFREEEEAEAVEVRNGQTTDQSFGSRDGGGRADLKAHTDKTASED